MAIQANSVDILGTKTSPQFEIATVVDPGTFDKVTSSNLAQLLTDIICFSLFPAIQVMGICTNALNMHIFARMGLHDTVTVSFFALSFSDCGQLVVAHLIFIFYAMERSPWRGPVEPYHLNYLTVWYYLMLLDISCLTMTYIALQRCLCVALPLRFNQVFSRRRTVGCIACIYVVMISWYTPMFAKQGLIVLMNPVTNVSRLVLHFAEGRQEVLALHDIVDRVVLKTAMQLIVLTCLIVLTHSLRASSKFRQSSSSAGFTGGAGQDSSQISKTEVYPHAESSENTTKKGSKQEYQRKQTQVIQVVTLTSVIFVVCNTPSVLIAFMRQFVPGFDLFQRYNDIYLLMNLAKNMIEFLNAALNFFVYFKFNSKFRKTVHETYKRVCG